MTKAHANAAFKESIDMVIRLNVDPKHGDQLVRGTCNLPHSLGKKSIVAVLTDDSLKEQYTAMADMWVDESVLADIKAGKIAFTKLICT